MNFTLRSEGINNKSRENFSTETPLRSGYLEGRLNFREIWT